MRVQLLKDQEIKFDESNSPVKDREQLIHISYETENDLGNE